MNISADFVPVEMVTARPVGQAGLILLADHAANTVPSEIGTLGLDEADMGRHIAFDVGIRDVTLGLAERMGAAAVLSTWSRLVIDPNRGEDDPTLIMKLNDGSIIPGNRHVGTVETERRLNAYHRPYHDRITATIDETIARGLAPVLVSMHSFTPAFRGRPPRPWHVGLLWDRDDRMVMPLMDRLRAGGDLCVGDNEPYSGQLRGDCMYRHGTARGIPHVLIEIRNDLIDTAEGQRAWADRLAPMIAGAMADAL